MIIIQWIEEYFTNSEKVFLFAIHRIIQGQLNFYGY